MRKLYISCPMRDRTEEDIRKSREKMHKVAEILFEQELEVIDSYFVDTADLGQHAVWYLGSCIRLMSEADYFIGVTNCFDYDSCEIEKDIARRYKIRSTLVDVFEVAPDCIEKTAAAVSTALGLGLSGFFGGK